MDAEDRHLCIVCNQTISGLLNYVLHRKNNCADPKISGDKGNFPVTSIKIEVQESEKKRSNITQSKANEPILIGQENEGQTIVFLQDDSSVDVQDGNSISSVPKNEKNRLDKKNEETVSDGVKSLPGFNCDTVSSLSDSNRERYSYSSDSLNELFSDGESLNFAHQHDIDTKSSQVSDVNQFSEQLNAGDVSDNVESVLLHTAAVEESWPDSEKTSYATADTVWPINTSVESEFGILSFNVNGSKKMLQLDVENDCPKENVKDKIQGKSKRKYKRKPAASKNGYIRTVEKACKRKGHKKFEMHDKMGNKQLEIQDVKNRNIMKVTKDDVVSSLIYSNDLIGYESSVRVEDAVHDDKEKKVFPGFESDPVEIKMEINNYNVSQDRIGAQAVNGTLSCTVCDKPFPNKQKLMTHLLTAYHNSQGNSKEGQHLSQVEMNQKAIIEESPFRCDLCMFYFNSSIYLEQHLKSKTHKENFATSDTLIMCSLCQFVAQSNVQLISHFHSLSHEQHMEQNNTGCAITVSKIQKKKIKVCKICPSEFNKTSSLKLHYQTAEHIRRKLALNREKEMLTLEEEEKDSDEEMESGLCKYDHQNTRKEGNVSEVGNQLNRFKSQEIKEVDNQAMVTKHSENNDLTSLFNSDNEILSSNQNEPKMQNKLRLSVCKFCAFETRNYNEMRTHYMKEHSQMVKICDVCDIVFPHGRGYKLHVNGKEHQMNLEKYGKKDLFQCHVCDKKFVEESYAKFHTAYYHYHLNTEEDLLREGRESITQTKYADFLGKIKVQGKNDQVSCPECGISLRKANVIGHLRLHTGEKPFKCNLCSEAFFNTFSLRRHLVQHFECWEKSCEICGESFKCKSRYNCHMDIHKAKVTGSGKSNICHICGDAFYIKRKLKEHMSVHMEKTLKCNFPGCLWAFSTKHALKRHMLTHSDENPFICPTCGYATKSEKYLKKHEEIHTKPREFFCEHCPYKAMTRTHLRRHMRIHLGIKPFKCPYCSYACNTHDNIRKHILETSFHKGLKVYPCRLCSFATNSTSEYRTHIRLEHKEIPDENLRGSLAVLSGLFNKEEETKAITECKEILPCKERKSPKKKAPSSVGNREAQEQGVVGEHEIAFEEVEIL